jgi:hypothetical protein
VEKILQPSFERKEEWSWFCHNIFSPIESHYNFTSELNDRAENLKVGVGTVKNKGAIIIKPLARSVKKSLFESKGQKIKILSQLKMELAGESIGCYF